MNIYLVIKDRASEFPNPVKVSKGEAVKCLKESDENGDWKGWVYCRTKCNEGWIPEQIITRDNDSGFIIKDYDATELNITTDEIVMEEYTLNGWIFGYKENEPMNRGWIPLNHLKPKEVK